MSKRKTDYSSEEDINNANYDKNHRKKDRKNLSKKGGTRMEENSAREQAERKDRKILSKKDESRMKRNNREENSGKKKLERPNDISNKNDTEMLQFKTGGAYIPPAKLKMMQSEICDKSSMAYQRLSWEALKKSIHGLINKVSSSNIGIISVDMFKLNIMRGKGLLCKSLIQSQAASQKFTNVYAALTAVINSKMPEIGNLLIKRLLATFKRSYRRNFKSECICTTIFIAHLVNQAVAHEILALEILAILMENSTDDSIEVAVAMLKECGQKLTEVSGSGTNAIFEMLRNILHEGKLTKRIQYMIEVMFQIRKDGFKEYPAIPEELDLVFEEDQITHYVTTEDLVEIHDELNVFKFDPDYEQNEERYQTYMKDIIGDGDEDEDSNGDDDEDDGDDDEENEEQTQAIVDKTETNLIAFRKTVYLTINSSLDFEECAHKLMKMGIKPGEEMELCNMFIDCCSQQRTYEKFFGLLAERFCRINRIFVEPMQQLFADSYSIVHRFDTNKLRNVSKFFAHLLVTDAISWDVLSIIRLNEEDTTSSSRVFIKILFQELCEFMGLIKLNERIKNPILQETALQGLFPKDNPKNTRFSINFFTSIGLGGLTDDLRDHLKRIKV